MEMKDQIAEIAMALRGMEDIASGLTEKKIHQRGRFLCETSDPDVIEFEVERHHGVLGAMYTPGAPLNAYLTRWIRYTFNRKTKEIKELEGDARPPYFDVDSVNYHGVAEEHLFDVSYSFEKLDAGEYLFEESRDNLSTKVKGLEEAIGLALGEVQGMDLSYFFDEVSDVITPDLVKLVEERLKDVLKNEVAEKITQAWIQTSESQL